MMNVKTRVTAAGTEYWDAKEKRVRFVPAGKEPSFEVTENPKSMLMGVDLANEKDFTAINGELIDDSEDSINLSKMTIPQLKEFAAAQSIEIPSEVTKKTDIIKLLTKEE